MRQKRLLASVSPLTAAVSCFLLCGWFLVLPRAARADYQCGGTLDSIEWLVDSSYKIVVATVVPLDHKTPVADSTYALRITEILKQPRNGKSKVGDVLAKTHPKDLPAVGTRSLLFFHRETDVSARVTIELPAVYKPTKEDLEDVTDADNLAVDELGNAIQDPRELLKRITERVEAGRRSTPDHSPKVSQVGFVYGQFYGNEDYYDLLVPADNAIRAVLEKDPDLEAKSLLYRYYANRTEAQRATDRQDDLRRNVEEAKARFHKTGPKLLYQSVVTYPAVRYGKTSPHEKYTALLEGHLLLLYATANDELIYRGPNSHHGDAAGDDPFSSLIFSPDGNYFAHVLATGDVSVFNLAKKKPQAVGKLGWNVAADRLCDGQPVIRQFTFSPNSHYVALNLAQGEAGRGSAVLVWNGETGACLYTKSKHWELNKELRLVGFGPYSDDIQVTESSYWSLSEKRPLSFVWTGWLLPNPGGETWNEAPLLRNDVPFVKVVAPPGD